MELLLNLCVTQIYSCTDHRADLSYRSANICFFLIIYESHPVSSVRCIPGCASNGERGVWHQRVVLRKRKITLHTMLKSKTKA